MNPQLLPTNGEYRDFMAHPGVSLLDPELRACRPDLDALGLPRAITGNFAAVFRLQGPGSRAWAVKCFTRELPTGDRYSRISQALSGLRETWNMEFAWQDPGLRMGARELPILKMEWVQGQGLDRYVEGCRGDPARMSLLAANLAAVVARMEGLGIAHGDLQHGNILVTDQGIVRLVDYDGMFVPGLEGLPPSEQGHRNYQSPLRTARHFGPFLDRFSAWILYGSLVALASRPELWGLRRTGEEALLLTREDYEVTRSPLLGHLAALPDPRCRALAERLQAICRLDPSQVPPLDLRELPPPFFSCPGCRAPRPLPWDTRSCGACGSPFSGAAHPVEVGGGSLPDWVTERMAAEAPRPGLVPPSPVAGAPRAAGAPGAATSEAPAPAPPSPPRFPEDALWLGRGSLVGFLVVLRLLAEFNPPFALDLPAPDLGLRLLLVLWLGCGLLGLGASYLLSTRNGEMRRRRSAADRASERLRELGTALDLRIAAAEREEAKEHSEITRLQGEVDRDEEQARAQYKLRIAGLKQELQSLETEARRARKEIEGAPQQVRATLAALEREEKAALERARQARAREGQQRRLETATIRAARLHGLGDVTKRRLEEAGFCTAADLVDYETRPGSSYFGTEMAWLRHRNGRLLHVPGVGPEKAATLVAWRRRLEALAPQVAAPGPETDEELAEQFQRRRLLLEDRLRKLEAEAGPALARLNQDLDQERSRVQRELATLHGPASGLEKDLALQARRDGLADRLARLQFQTRQEVAKLRAQAAPELQRAQGEVARALADVAACGGLGFRAWLRALAFRDP